MSEGFLRGRWLHIIVVIKMTPGWKNGAHYRASKFVKAQFWAGCWVPVGQHPQDGPQQGGARKRFLTVTMGMTGKRSARRHKLNIWGEWDFRAVRDLVDGKVRKNQARYYDDGNPEYSIQTLNLYRTNEKLNYATTTTTYDVFLVVTVAEDVDQLKNSSGPLSKTHLPNRTTWKKWKLKTIG